MDATYFRECLLESYKTTFGIDALPEMVPGSSLANEESFQLTIDDKIARVDLRTLDVQCDDPQLQHMVSTMTKKLYQSLAPSAN